MSKKFSIILVFIAHMIVVMPSVVSAGTGEFDSDNQYPSVGGMIAPYLGFFPGCSGVLIEESVLLTAAHCVDILIEYWDEINENGGLWVSFQPDPFASLTCSPTSNFETDCGWVPVVEVIQGDNPPSPSFIPPPFATNADDIAALILATPQPSENIAPYVTYSGAIEDMLQGIKRKDIKLTAAGYGGTPVFPGPAPAITYWDIRLIDHPRFLSLYDDQYLLTQQNPAADNTGVCFGDSGGPLFLQLADGSELLIGLVSGGPLACISTAYYYRLDTPGGQAFIEYITMD